MSSTTAGPKGALQPNTLIAGAAIVRGTAIKRGADLTHGVQATANSVNLGIAIDDQATAEKPFPIADRPGESVEARSGAAFALDALLTSDAAGKLVTAATRREGDRHRSPGGDSGRPARAGRDRPARIPRAVRPALPAGVYRIRTLITAGDARP
jgi:hypothetical protein